MKILFRHILKFVGAIVCGAAGFGLLTGLCYFGIASEGISWYCVTYKEPDPNIFGKVLIGVTALGMLIGLVVVTLLR